jgi:hypothetical protein
MVCTKRFASRLQCGKEAKGDPEVEGEGEGGKPFTGREEGGSPTASSFRTVDGKTSLRSSPRSLSLLLSLPLSDMTDLVAERR